MTRKNMLPSEGQMDDWMDSLDPEERATVEAREGRIRRIIQELVFSALTATPEPDGTIPMPPVNVLRRLERGDVLSFVTVLAARIGDTYMSLTPCEVHRDRNCTECELEVLEFNPNGDSLEDLLPGQKAALQVVADVSEMNLPQALTRMKDMPEGGLMMMVASLLGFHATLMRAKYIPIILADQIFPGILKDVLGDHGGLIDV